jgi:hypothetical protein
MKQKIKTGILMTALAVGSLHIVNRCAQAFATVKNLLDKHKGAFYDWRFGQVYYTKIGSGSPLLLVHDLATRYIAWIFLAAVVLINRT